jgi:Protein of unknown function (DUF3828)
MIDLLSRRSVIVAVAALALMPGLPGQTWADPAAQAFLEKIYAAYKGKKSKGIPLGSDGAIRAYFEPGLAALMIKDIRDAAKTHDVGTLDSDPFIGGQDWEITGVMITVTDTAPDHANAAAKFMNFKKPQTVQYDLVKLKQGWRIADITWQSEDGNPPDTLRGLYVKK